MKFIIKNLVLHDFKGIRDFEIDFDSDVTDIFGENATGKSTLVDAVFWVLFGKNSQGNSKFEVFPLDSEDNIIENTTPTIKMFCEISGKKQVFTRSKDGSKTTFNINGNELKQKDYKLYISSFVSEDMFATLLSPVYFGDNYTWQKQRSTIVDSMNIKDIVLDNYESVSDDIVELGADKAQDKWKKELKRLEKKKDGKVGERDYLMKKLDEITTSSTEEDLVAQRDLMNTIIREMEASLDNVHPLKDKLNSINRDIQNLELKQKDIIRKKETEITMSTREKENLLAKYKQIGTELNQIKDTCPTCGSKLDEFSIATQKKSLADKLDEIKEEGKTKASEIDKLKSELDNIKSQPIATDEKIRREKIELQISEIESKVNYSEIREMKSKLHDIEDMIKDFETIVRQKKELDECLNQIQVIMEDYDEAEANSEDIVEYKKEYAQHVADVLNSKLDRVQIKTFSIQANGDTKDTFEISMDGVPYASLNSAGKIEAGVELIQLISEAKNLWLPIIIDNKESITKTFNVPNQIITLSVKKGAELGV